MNERISRQTWVTLETAIKTNHNSHIFGVQFWKRAVHHGEMGVSLIKDMDDLELKTGGELFRVHSTD